MKKILLLSVITTISLFANNFQELNATQIEKLSNISIFKKPHLTIDSGHLDKDNKIYLLNAKISTPRGDSFLPVIMDPETNTTFVGTAYDSKGNKIVAPVDKKAVNFSFGNGKKGELYLFTDPQCPYCKRLEQEYGEKLKDYKVNVILFPLSFHKNAKPMMQWILAGKDNDEKAKRYQDLMLGKSDNWKKAKYNPDDKDFLKIIKASTKAFNLAGAKGTPDLRDENLNPINPDSL